EGDGYGLLGSKCCERSLHRVAHNSQRAARCRRSAQRRRSGQQREYGIDRIGQHETRDWIVSLVGHGYGIYDRPSGSATTVLRALIDLNLAAKGKIRGFGIENWRLD